MKTFECIKNLTVVHRYVGGVFHYKIGQIFLESTLIRQRVEPSPEYFKQIERK